VLTAAKCAFEVTLHEIIRLMVCDQADDTSNSTAVVAAAAADTAAAAAATAAVVAATTTAAAMCVHCAAQEEAGWRTCAYRCCQGAEAGVSSCDMFAVGAAPTDVGRQSCCLADAGSNKQAQKQE
jgi:hypothetical protein